MSASICRWLVSTGRRLAWLCKTRRKHPNLTIQHHLRESKQVALGTQPGYRGSREVNNLENTHQIGNKKWEADVSMEKIWESLRIPSRAIRRHFSHKLISKDWRKWLLPQMQKEQCKTSKSMKNQGTMTLPKEHNDFPVTDSKEMKIYYLPDKEFKITILRKLGKLQENTERQCNEVRNTIHEQKKFMFRHKNYKKNSGAEEYSE